MTQVKLENVSKTFGNIKALTGLSLDIYDKEFFVLLGPTGAGKTTTLRCIAGLEKPEKGSILIESKNVIDWSPAERDVALVFQYYSLYPHYTVRQNLEFPLKAKIRNLSAQQITQRVARAATILQIEPLLDRKTDNLSGGEMQRVAIGRAIVRDPKVFLMDEPLSNLDAKLREILRTELKRLQVELGATFLFVTHDQVEAMTMGDRIGILHHGELIQVGSPYEVYHNPKDIFVASFIGTPTINIFDAVVEDQRITLGGGHFEFEMAPGTCERMNGIRGDIQIGVRAEDIVMPAENGITGQIYGVENMGMEKIVTLKVHDLLFKATVDPKLDVDVDAETTFAFAQEKMHFFDKDSGKNLLA